MQLSFVGKQNMKSIFTHLHLQGMKQPFCQDVKF